MKHRFSFSPSWLILAGLIFSLLASLLNVAPASAGPLSSPPPVVAYGFPLYVANYGNNTISKVTADGSVSTFVSSGLNGPTGLALGPDGYLYVANNNSNTISRVSPSGVVSNFATSGVDHPNQLAFDDNGNLYVANTSGSISKILPGGTATTFLSLYWPTGVAVLDGYLYIAQYGYSQVVKYDLSNVNNNSVLAVIDGPNFLAANPAGGQIYMSAITGGKLKKVSLSGTVVDIATGLAYPEGLAFDGHGYLYVANANSNSISKVSPDGGSVTTFATGLSAPYGLAFSPVQAISVKGNNVTIANGDTTPSSNDNTDFGAADTNGGTVDHTFTIANVGGQILTLTGSPDLVTLSGSGDFSVTTQPASATISVGGTQTFVVHFAPTSLGIQTATVSIASDDTSNNPYTFDIQGKGCQSNLVVTNNNDSGAGSLRQAIQDLCSGGVITFDNNYTITLASQLPTIDKTVTIDGNGALNTIIQAAASPNTADYRIFDVGANGNLTLGGLTLQNGGNDALNFGGAISIDQGILAITNSVISNNRAYFGGAIYNYGTVSITSTVFSDNQAGTYGGAIANDSALAVEGSTFTQNSVQDANGGGGAIGSEGISTTITNSTFSANSAVYGGGIESDWNTLTVNNSTFSGNISTYGGGIYLSDGTLDLTNTILANSVGSADCYKYENNTTIDINNNNLIENNATATNACGTPAVASDPMLGALGTYGGTTQSFALLPGSPAVDAGDNASCPATDQRGVTRPQGLGCDIGAYEYDTQVFSDVPLTYWATNFIDRLYASGITGGCSTSPLMYCPETSVTRAQMAVFLLRGEHGSAYTPPDATGTIFSDVPLGHWAGAWIEQLAAEGITAGCGPNLFCPDAPVARDQMAVFLLRAKHGPGYIPPEQTGVFSDVPTNFWAAAWIEELAAEGITGGCGPSLYCPTTVVTRDQMAVFLVRTFNLP